MSLQDLINWLNLNSQVVIGYYLIILTISFIGLILFKNKLLSMPVKYFYSVLVYSVSIPGIFSLILTLYSFFILRQNLLNLDLMVYAVPIIGSIIVLTIINKTIKMALIPGFKRLSGLFTLIMIVGFVTYMLQKMFFGILIIGSFKTLIIIFIALLIIVKIAMNKISK